MIPFLPLSILVGCTAAWLLGQPHENRIQHLCRITLLIVSLALLYGPLIFMVLIGFHVTDPDTERNLFLDSLLIFAFYIAPLLMMLGVYFISRRKAKSNSLA